MNKCLLFFLTLLLACACQKSAKQPQKKDNQLRINISGEPATLDPRKGGDLISSTLHFMLFEGLTRVNSDSSLSLAQAESVELSEDRKTYTFHLRGCKWSDGSEVTAYDFETSWKDTLDPLFPSPNAHLFYPIKNAESAKKGRVHLDSVGIRSKDAHTLIVELEKPAPYFLQLVSFCAFFPVNHKVDRVFSNWSKDACEHFVCNGPFTLDSWKHSDEICIKKNEYYWDQEAVHLDSIRISMVENETTTLHMYENGELDILGMPLSPLPIDAVPGLARQGMLKIKPTAGTTFFAFNMQKFPFNNLHIRQAFSYAVDRAAIVANITQLDEIVATGLVPPVLKNNKITAFFQDGHALLAKEHFQKGLQELGIKASDLHGITYHYSSSELNHKIAQVLQQQWFDVLGVKVHLENLERKILMDKMTARDFTLAQGVCVAQCNDPINLLERFKYKDNVKNYAGWQNAEYIRLLEQSAENLSSEARLHILEQAESVFIQDLPLCPLFHWNFAFLMKPYVKGLDMAPMGGFSIEKITLDIQ